MAFFGGNRAIVILTSGHTGSTQHKMATFRGMLRDVSATRWQD